MTASRGLRKTVHKPMTYTPPPPLYVIGEPGVAEVKGKHSYGCYPQAVKAAAAAGALVHGGIQIASPILSERRRVSSG